MKFNINNSSASSSINILEECTMINGKITSPNKFKTKKFSDLKEGITEVKCGKDIVKITKKGKSLSYKTRNSEFNFKSMDNDCVINADDFIDEDEEIKKYIVDKYVDFYIKRNEGNIKKLLIKIKGNADTYIRLDFEFFEKEFNKHGFKLLKSFDGEYFTINSIL